MYTKRQWNKPQNTTQKSNNEKKETPKNENKTKSEGFKYKCHRCRKIGYKATDCTASKKDVDNANAADEASLFAGAEEYALATETVEARIARSNEKWCLDSGCTTHMGNNDAEFVSTLEPCNAKRQ